MLIQQNNLITKNHTAELNKLKSDLIAQKEETNKEMLVWARGVQSDDLFEDDYSMVEFRFSE